jgi:ubiquinone/menaquinone biosynthesis C-methylase UbiE
MNHSLREDLRAFYDAEGAVDYQARLYSSRDWPHQRLKEVVMAELLAQLRPDVALLDVGCAEGLYMRTVSDSVGLAIGVDLSYPKVVRGAALSSSAKHLAFALADAEHVPYAASSFDIVLCVETLEHVPDYRSALAELLRVLKPTGTLVVSVPTERDELGGGYKAQLTWSEKSGHLHSLCRTGFSEVLTASGFEIRKQMTVDMLGGRVRYAIVSSWPWRIARAGWRAVHLRGKPSAGHSSLVADSEPAPAPVTVGLWRRLDSVLTHMPGLRRWASLGVWVCSVRDDGQ